MGGERNPDLLLCVAARVTVAAGSDERVNQANDRALIPFRQRLHALKSLPQSPLLWGVVRAELGRFDAEQFIGTDSKYTNQRNEKLRSR